VLVVIMTDGLPTDDDGEDEIAPFLAELRALPPDVHVQLVACAEASECLHYVHDAERELSSRLDVSDLYPLERARVLARHVRQGGSEAAFAFSYGDYLSRALLAPIDPEVAALDRTPEQDAAAAAAAASASASALAAASTDAAGTLVSGRSRRGSRRKSAAPS
jgi:hypothetical protein